MPLTYFGGKFYSRSGVCLPLQITNAKFGPWEYSTAIFLVINLLSFIMIFVGYVVMFVVVRRTSQAAGSVSRRETALARRMTFIVMTDFMCWVPIIVMSILGLCDIHIPDDLYAVTAVFILPLNSSINPILYTISTLDLKRKTKKKLKEMSNSYGEQMNTQITGVVNGIRDDSKVHWLKELDGSRFIPSMSRYHTVNFQLAPLNLYLKPRGPGQRDRVDIGDVMNILRDVASAMAVLHRNGLIHRSIDEDHVLVEESTQESSLHAFLVGSATAREVKSEANVTFSGDVLKFGKLVKLLLKECTNDKFE
ncbi:relaxin receptor 2-like [Glandiceps talaboti]